MDDSTKLLMGAGLAVIGGFISTQISEFLKRKQHDREVLAEMHTVFLKIISVTNDHVELISGTECSGKGVVAEEITTLLLLSFKLMTRRTRSFAVRIITYCMVTQLHYNNLLLEELLEQCQRLISERMFCEAHKAVLTIDPTALERSAKWQLTRAAQDES